MTQETYERIKKGIEGNISMCNFNLNNYQRQKLGFFRDLEELEKRYNK